MHLGAVVRRKNSVVDGQELPDDRKTTKKKFVIRLASALHASGNLTFRTEKLISRVSRKIGLHLTMSILPKRLHITFHENLALDPTKSESYIFDLPSSWDVHKLILLEQLCWDLTMRKEYLFTDALDKLEEVETLPRLYSRAIMVVVYFVASFSSALLFYGGSATDAAWAGLLGCAVVYVVSEEVSSRLPGLGEVTNFTCAFACSIVATLLDNHLYSGGLCVLAVTYGSVVWLLPGLSITTALLEVYSGMTTFGTAKLVNGIAQASQLGFGLALGRLLFADDGSLPESFITGCRSPPPAAYGFFLLPLASVSFSMMINASYKQLPGMVICSAVGQFSSYWFDRYNVSSAAGSFLCALLVTTASRLWAWWHNDERPLTYLIAGLIVLVPGGVGVKGALRSTLSGDQRGGLDFTFDMVMIGITLAIGVFVSLVPTTRWFFGDKRRAHHHPVIWTLVSPSSSFTGDEQEHEQEQGLEQGHEQEQGRDPRYGDSRGRHARAAEGEAPSSNTADYKDKDKDEGEEDEDEETGLSTPASVTPFQPPLPPQPRTQQIASRAVHNPMHTTSSHRDVQAQGQRQGQGQGQGLGLGQGHGRGGDVSLSLGVPNSDALLRMLGSRSSIAYSPGRTAAPATAAAAALGPNGAYASSAATRLTRPSSSSSFGSSSDVGSVL